MLLVHLFISRRIFSSSSSTAADEEPGFSCFPLSDGGSMLAFIRASSSSTC